MFSGEPVLCCNVSKASKASLSLTCYSYFQLIYCDADLSLAGEIPLIKVTGNSLERDGAAEADHGPLGTRGEPRVHAAHGTGAGAQDNHFSDAAQEEEESASNTSDGMQMLHCVS